MKHILLDYHTGYCEIQFENIKKSKSEHKKFFIANHCGLNKCIIYVKGQFLLLEYPKCNNIQGEYLFVKWVVEQIYSNKCLNKNLYNVENGYELTEKFIKEKHKLSIIEKKSFEINFVYSNFVKTFGIISREYLIDKIEKSDDIRNDYMLMLEEIENQDYCNNEKKQLISDLNKLLDYNYIPNYKKDYIVEKSLEEIIKHLNKKQ